MELITLNKPLTEFQSKAQTSGVWLDGPFCRELEQKLSEYLGVKHIILVNSSTSAFIAIYWILKQEFSSITACAYNWPVTYQTARLVNLEVRFKRLLLQSKTELASNSLNVISHLFGQANSLLAQSQGKPFIEDVRQAFGAEFRGQKLGTFGKMSCFSFSPSMNLYANGLAAAIGTNDDSYAKEVRNFCGGALSQGISSESVALDLRLDEIKAEFLIQQLHDFDRRMSQQREIVNDYLSVLPFEQPLLQEEQGDRHVFSACNLLIEKRDEFVEFLNNKKIESKIYYSELSIPVDQRRLYADISSSIVAIPCRWNLSGEEVKRIRQALREWFS
jgi:dTDP-4-amino-4,6-dideoxygalactose transaminase